MVLAIALLLLGILLLGLELLLPSAGILTVAGILSIVGWIVAAFVYGGVLIGALAMVVTALLIPVLFALAIRWWPQTPAGRAILIGETAHEHQRPLTGRARLLGRRGVTLSRMLPSGAIEVDGQSYDAITEGMPLDAGVDILVSAIQGNSLIVTRAPDNADPHPDASQGASDETESKPRDTPHETLQTPWDEWIPDPFDDSLG